MTNLQKRAKQVKLSACATYRGLSVCSFVACYYTATCIFNIFQLFVISTDNFTQCGVIIIHFVALSFSIIPLYILLNTSKPRAYILVWAFPYQDLGKLCSLAVSLIVIDL